MRASYSRRSIGDESVAERVAGCLRGVRAPRLAEDRPDVVRRGVLADVQHAADLAVRAAARDLDEDLDLARAQAVGAARRSRRLDVGVELGRATGERGQPDRPGEAERDPELAA